MHAYDQMTEPELKEHFEHLARAIHQMTPDQTGFIILCAPMNQSGVTQFVSNVDQGCAAEWMVETVARWANGDSVVER